MVKDTKIAVNTWFNTNWTDTLIHFYGLDWDITGKEEWILVAYEPMQLRQDSIDFAGYKQNGKIIVSFYARKENRTFELLDILMNKLKTVDINNLISSGATNIIKDRMNTTNGDYSILTAMIYLKSF